MFDSIYHMTLIFISNPISVVKRYYLVIVRNVVMDAITFHENL